MVQELGGAAPFWLDRGIQPSTMVYVFGLVVVTAAIAGILPALHTTRRRAGPDRRGPDRQSSGQHHALAGRYDHHRSQSAKDDSHRDLHGHPRENAAQNSQRRSTQVVQGTI